MSKAIYMGVTTSEPVYKCPDCQSADIYIEGRVYTCSNCGSIGNTNDLTSITQVARKVKKLYMGVDGKARKVKKGFIGVGGKARLFYSSGPGYQGRLTDLSTACFYKTMAANPTHLLIVGGQTSNVSGRGILQTTEAYNTSFTKLTTVANTTYGITNALSFAVNGKAIIWGGSDGSTSQRSYYSYDSNLTMGLTSSTYATQNGLGTSGVTATNYGYAVGGSRIIRLNSSLTVTSITRSMSGLGFPAANIDDSVCYLRTSVTSFDESTSSATYEIMNSSGTVSSTISGTTLGGTSGGADYMDAAALNDKAVFTTSTFYNIINNSGTLTKTTFSNSGEYVSKLGNGAAMFKKFSNIVYFIDSAGSVSQLDNAPVYVDGQSRMYRHSERQCFNNKAVFCPTYSGTTSAEVNTNASQFVASKVIYAYEA